jgi:predicted transcriptional regulator YdeE
MDHEVRELAGFDAVGLRCECPGRDTAAIGPLWDAFFEQAGKLPESRGVVGLSWGDGADGFSYLAGHKVEPGQGAALAQERGLEALSVRGGRYVCVDWRGTPDEMKAMFQDIFKRILPENGYRLTADGVCVEDYPQDCLDTETNTMRCQLQVEIEQ